MLIRDESHGKMPENNVHLIVVMKTFPTPALTHLSLLLQQQLVNHGTVNGSNGYKDPVAVGHKTTSRKFWNNYKDTGGNI
jgi:hypothetical protein